MQYVFNALQAVIGVPGDRKLIMLLIDRYLERFFARYPDLGGLVGDSKVPTLVMAGRDDFVFPPEHQGQLAAGIPNARLEIIERAGHNPHDERTAQVMKAVSDFISATVHAPRTLPSRPRERFKVTDAWM